MVTRSQLRRVADEARAARVLWSRRVLPLEPPRRMKQVTGIFKAYGSTGGVSALAALRHGPRTAIVDELGSVTFDELDRQANSIANAWRAAGLSAGDAVALLMRNHRGFFQAFFAAQKLGAAVVLMNTDFAGPQLADAARREGVRALVLDEEFVPLADAIETPLGRYVAWRETDQVDGDLAALGAGDTTPPPAPDEHARLILLTSGTTGAPKGARRRGIPTLTTMGGFLDAVPFKARERIVIPAPAFHSFGFGACMLSLMLGSTMILRRRFNPALVLDDIEHHRATGMALVPIMLRRVLDAQDEAPRDMSSLDVVLTSGSQLGATLATRTLETLGDVLYNMYGSTEVATATIAGPKDLRRAPGCAGRPPLGSRIAIYDRGGLPAPRGATGTIYVGNYIPFEGYTGGGSKPVIDGLVSSGDVGHMDEHGLLHVDGRDDSMIVSGGENVFPDEVEDCLRAHHDVVDAAAIGVDDEEFGQRLRAFVVPRDGSDMTADEVRQHVKQSLARYKVPRDVVFLDDLPRNPTGKVLKRELARIEVAD
jgi:fatty-acyl-CoA synthase